MSIKEQTIQLQLLLIDAFDSGRAGRIAYSIFRDSIQRILGQTKIRNPLIISRKVEESFDYVIDWDEHILSEAAKNCAKNFDKLDFIVVGGDLKIHPSHPNILPLILLLRAAKKTKKAVLSCGFGALSSVYSASCQHLKLFLLNGPNGDNIDKIPTFPRYSIGSLREKGVFLDNQTGDMYLYDKKYRFWRSICNVGLYLLKSSLEKHRPLSAGPTSKSKNSSTPVPSHIHGGVGMGGAKYSSSRLSKDVDLAHIRSVFVQHEFLRSLPQSYFEVVNRAAPMWAINNNGALPAGVDLNILADGSDGPVLLTQHHELLYTGELGRGREYALSEQVMVNFFSLTHEKIMASTTGRIDLSLLQLTFGEDGLSGGNFSQLSDPASQISPPLGESPISSLLPSGPQPIALPDLSLFGAFQRLHKLLNHQSSSHSFSLPPTGTPQTFSLTPNNTSTEPKIKPTSSSNLRVVYASGKDNLEDMLMEMYGSNSNNASGSALGLGLGLGLGSRSGTGLGFGIESDGKEGMLIGPSGSMRRSTKYSLGTALSREGEGRSDSRNIKVGASFTGHIETRHRSESSDEEEGGEGGMPLDREALQSHQFNHQQQQLTPQQLQEKKNKNRRKKRLQVFLDQCGYGEDHNSALIHQLHSSKSKNSNLYEQDESDPCDDVDVCVDGEEDGVDEIESQMRALGLTPLSRNPSANQQQQQQQQLTTSRNNNSDSSFAGNLAILDGEESVGDPERDGIRKPFKLNLHLTKTIAPTTRSVQIRPKSGTHLTTQEGHTQGQVQGEGEREEQGIVSGTSDQGVAMGGSGGGMRSRPGSSSLQRSEHGGRVVALPAHGPISAYFPSGGWKTVYRAVDTPPPSSSRPSSASVLRTTNPVNSFALSMIQQQQQYQSQSDQKQEKEQGKSYSIVKDLVNVGGPPKSRPSSSTPTANRPVSATRYELKPKLSPSTLLSPGPSQLQFQSQLKTQLLRAEDRAAQHPNQPLDHHESRSQLNRRFSTGAIQIPDLSSHRRPPSPSSSNPLGELSDDLVDFPPELLRQLQEEEDKQIQSQQQKQLQRKKMFSKVPLVGSLAQNLLPHKHPKPQNVEYYATLLASTQQGTAKQQTTQGKGIPPGKSGSLTDQSSANMIHGGSAKNLSLSHPSSSVSNPHPPHSSSHQTISHSPSGDVNLQPPQPFEQVIITHPSSFAPPSRPFSSYKSFKPLPNYNIYEVDGQYIGSHTQAFQTPYEREREEYLKSKEKFIEPNQPFRNTFRPSTSSTTTSSSSSSNPALIGVVGGAPYPKPPSTFYQAGGETLPIDWTLIRDNNKNKQLAGSWK